MKAREIRELILYVAERPEGYAVLHRFIQAAEAGHQPDPEDCRKIADGLREILHGDKLTESLHSFAKVMQLKAKQGRRRTGNATDHEFEAAVQVWLHRLRGKTPAEANTLVAQQLMDCGSGEQDALRSVQRYVKENHSAKGMAAWIIDIERRANKN